MPYADVVVTKTMPAFGGVLGARNQHEADLITQIIALNPGKHVQPWTMEYNGNPLYVFDHTKSPDGTNAGGYPANDEFLHPSGTAGYDNELGGLGGSFDSSVGGGAVLIPATTPPVITKVILTPPTGTGSGTGSGGGAGAGSGTTTTGATASASTTSPLRTLATIGISVLAVKLLFSSHRS